jgi:AbrB family looped-hinge helix DNA binding protein
MAKVTTKLQITIPKALADEYGIAPGDHIEFQAAGQAIRILPKKAPPGGRLSLEERLRIFDAATDRQREREKSMPLPQEPVAERDWTREELYTRGPSR